MCFERDRRSLSPGSCSPSCLVSFVFSPVAYFTLYIFRHISNLNSIINLKLVSPQPFVRGQSVERIILSFLHFVYLLLIVDFQYSYLLLILKRLLGILLWCQKWDRCKSKPFSRSSSH